MPRRELRGAEFAKFEPHDRWAVSQEWPSFEPLVFVLQDDAGSAGSWLMSLFAHVGREAEIMISIRGVAALGLVACRQEEGCLLIS